MSYAGIDAADGRHVSRGRHVIALGAKSIAVLLLLLGYSAFFLETSQLDVFMATRGRLTNEAPYGTLGSMACLVGLRLLRQARRYRAVEVDSSPVDTREPVLYLRSFDADYRSAKLGYEFFAFTTEEEDFASLLTRIGPCVAVGRPGEALPQVGVHRVYIESSDWKAEVQRMMKAARIVVIRAGMTDGLLAELEMAVATIPPERVVVLTPSGKHTQALITEAFHRMRLGEVPVIPSRAPRGVSISSAIYFDRDWNPRVQSARVPFFSLAMIRPAIYALNEALRPAFATTGVPWLAAPRPYGRLVGLLMVKGMPGEAPTAPGTAP